MSYNGWRNYETWNVALWIDNEQSTYSERVTMAQDAYDATDESDTHAERLAEARCSFANTLEAWVDEMRPDLGPSMFSDMLNAALSEVDWDEIAENWLSEIDAPEPEIAE